MSKVKDERDEEDTIIAYGCCYSSCRGIWRPKVARPKACPKCKRYFRYEEGPKQRIPIRLKVPINYCAPKVALVKIIPFAVPDDIVELLCTRCGNSTTRGAMIKGKVYCTNCALQEMLEAVPKTRSFRDLLPKVKHE